MSSRVRPSSELDLDTPVTGVSSVGMRSAARLQKLGITTVRDLLWHLPSRYEDYSEARPIADVVVGEKHSIQGEVVAVGSRFIWPRRLTITTATIRDESGGIRAVWFNQPYLEETLAVGTRVSLAGKVVLDKRGLHLANPSFEKVSTDGEPTLRHTAGLVPVYPETQGVTSKYLRSLIQPLVERTIPDPLSVELRRTHDLPDITTALRAIHTPDDASDRDVAKSRLAFDDVLIFQLKALHDRRMTRQARAPKVIMDAPHVKELFARLSFTPTHDQRVALLELLRDMERGYPMNRLLEGDVGSGKTIVALVAALHAFKQGWQSALVAPTEVLARQHYKTLCVLAASDKNARGAVALLVGSAAILGEREVSKAALRRAIASGGVGVVIGTHAILEESVQFPKLALVVIDEQQRFGTAQRAALPKSGRAGSGLSPHLLSMTATPIPRTLALTVFGDLDISLLREKPAGRRPISTSIVGPHEREAMYAHIRDEIRAGRQAFVICSRIESSPVGETTVKGRGTQAKLVWAEVKAAEDERARLAKDVFPNLQLALLHGRMKPAEKERIMREFRDGRYHLLVSTSVIEVGVDVPNATVMVIEGADRFGLAQLHQFRGRVGRAEYASSCFLVPTDVGAGAARLKAMTQTEDGFTLAEHDLKTRGPGEFFGLKQSGLPDLTMMALADMRLVQKARAAARSILKTDPTLKHHPLLAKRLMSFQKLVHGE